MNWLKIRSISCSKIQIILSDESYLRKIEVHNTTIIFMGGEFMPVIKIIELIGSSTKSWEAAVQNAVTEAGKTINGIKGVHVKRCTAKIEDNKIVEYNADVKIAFTVKR